MPKPGKISQLKIAHDLGVSQALVSLVLNGRKTGINAETYERIWKHAIEVGYLPKGMRLDSTPAGAQPKQVGFILRSPLRLYTQSNFFSHVQHGLHTALEAGGIPAVFLGAEDMLNAAKLARVLKPGHTFQGIVLLGEVARPFLLALRKLERRIVAVSASFPGLCHSVLANEQQSLELLVEHLRQKGHQRIGWLGGNIGMGRQVARFSAFQSALRAQGLPLLKDYWVESRDADRADGAAATAKLLALAKRRDFPTALVCYNALLARGAINALAKSGWSVPGDLSIAAVDATRVTVEEAPTITCASANPEKMGEAAARLVLAGSPDEDASFTDLVLPSQLAAGESTAAPRR